MRLNKFLFKSVMSISFIYLIIKIIKIIINFGHLVFYLLGPWFLFIRSSYFGLMGLSCLKHQKRFYDKLNHTFLSWQRVFELHGAVQVHVPQVLPKSSLRIYDRTDKLVIGMNKSGDVICLPFDLRVPFARYIARTKINSMRRYCIAPVSFNYFLTF